jgi:hypothetical protein
VSANQTCDDCGADLTQAPDDEPCPHCGSHHRSVAASAAAACSVVGTAAATVAIEYSPTGVWWEQWRRTLRNLNEIRRLYDETDGSVDDLKAAVEQFFVACWHVNDYIRKDKSNLPMLNESRFWTYKDGDQDLTIAQTFANTYKHFERRQPNDPIARVKRVSVGPPHNLAAIAYEAPPQPEREYDALQLAEACVQSWETFFKAEGITPPV